MTGWAKVKQAARYAGISERTFRDWLHSGLKHARLPSGTILIRYSDIDTFLEGFAAEKNLVDEIVSEVCREFER